MEPKKVWPGKPYHLGAAYDGKGTKFTIFSEAAKRVEFCLFDKFLDKKTPSRP